MINARQLIIFIGLTSPNKFLLLFCAAILYFNCPAQVPKGFAYSPKQEYFVGDSITPLTPNFHGDGVIPNSIYTEVKLIKSTTNNQFPLPLSAEPSVICADGEFLYIADSRGSRIRKLDLTNVFTVVAGSSTTGYIDAKGAAARFNHISGIMVRKGYIYVSDNVSNVVRMISPTGEVSTLAGSGTAGKQDGNGKNASFKAPTGLTMDADGNLYVSDNGNDLIRKITPQGVVTTIANMSSPKGIAIDKDGNLFVVSGNNIEKITSQGAKSTFAGGSNSGFFDGKGRDAFFNMPQRITIDAHGNLYVSEFTRIRMISPDAEVTTLAGSDRFYNDDYGLGRLASFLEIKDLTIDQKGNLKVLDAYYPYTPLLKQVDLYGWSVTPELPLGLSIDSSGTINGRPERANSPKDYIISSSTPAGLKTATINISTVLKPGKPSIKYPSSVVFTVNKLINPITPVNSGGTVPLGAYGQASEFVGSGLRIIKAGIGRRAGFSTPRGLAFDGTHIYVADEDNAILKVSTNGVVTFIAGGASEAGYSNGRLISAIFRLPRDVAVSSNGEVYVADRVNNRIRRIDKTGMTIDFAGQHATGNADGIRDKASFKYPSSLAFDASGNLFVADEGNHLIRKITPDGKVSTFAGSVSGYLDGAGSNAKLNSPTGLAFDAMGNLYVADNGNFRIRKISPNGLVSTIAGSGQQLSTDGTGLSASFLNPVDLTVDQEGNLYVTDKKTVRKVTPSGVVTTFAEIPVYIPKTQVLRPINSVSIFGIAYDPVGLLYITDVSSGTIQKIGTLGYSITPKLPEGLSMNELGTISGTPTKASPLTEYIIEAHNAAGKSTSKILMEINLAPSIDEIVPTTAATGDKVYMVGNNLNDVISVSFGGIPAKSFTLGMGSIEAEVGEGSSGDVKVITSGGEAIFPGFVYKSVSGPRISSFSPQTARPGTEISINGFHFDGASHVYFGDKPASSFKVNSSTNITAIVGSGSGNVEVVTSLGISNYPGFLLIENPVIIPDGPTTFNLGGNVNLTTTNHPAYSYQWSKDGKDIPSATKSSFVATEKGDYRVTITVSGISGTSDPIKVNAVFALPTNNYRISTTGLSCKGQGDGKISISAQQPLNYTATLTGTNVNKSIALERTAELSGLPAGIYDLNISLAEWPDYIQSFKVKVTEPSDLSVYAVASKTKEELDLSLSGGSQYTIVLNEKTYFTSDSLISLPLEPGNNKLVITTDKLCQGTITKTIIGPGITLPYPNPVQNILNVDLGDVTIASSIIKIYSVSDGKLVKTENHLNRSGTIQIDMENLTTGVYTLVLSRNGSESVFKIVKR